MSSIGLRRIINIAVYLSLLFLLSIPLYGKNLYLHILIIIFLNVVLASSYRIFYIAGMGSMCHITFYALGAYASALSSIRLGLPWPICFLISGAIAAAFAAMISWSAVRSKGAYFFLVTFGFFIVMDAVIAHWQNLTGGRDGIRGIPKIMNLNNLTQYYYLILVFCIISVFILNRLGRSRFGRELLIIGDDDALAEATGIKVVMYKVIAFAIGAFFAGLAGSVYAHYMSFISPTSFGMWQSMYILIWVIIGGERKVWGPILGALLMSVLAEALRMTGKIQAIIYVAALLLVIMVMPHGLVGLVDILRSKLGNGEPGVGNKKLGASLDEMNTISSSYIGVKHDDPEG